METFGVLVAPAGRHWRARILTYPKALWVVPGGGGSMKFLGSRPQEAEKLAIEAIERQIEKRGFRKREVMPPVEIASVDPEQAPAPKGATAPASARKLLVAAVRFGHSKASQEAITANVSERGMFVSTSSPLDPGAAIRLRVDLEAFTVPLRGVVVWNRTRPEAGRPIGMGVRIFQPSSLYIEFVAQLP
jgi:hypothetical protein